MRAVPALVGLLVAGGVRPAPRDASFATSCWRTTQMRSISIRPSLYRLHRECPPVSELTYPSVLFANRLETFRASLLAVNVAAAVGAGIVILCLIAGSSSQGQVVVPTVVGDNVDVAYWRLAYAGFAVRIDEPIDLNSSVAGQSIAPGRKARQGTVVSLELGHSGPHGMLPPGPAPLEMPRLIGMRFDSAVGRLNALGLSWSTAPLAPLPPSTAPSLLANYEVRDQKPRPGSRFVQTVVTEVADGIRTKTTTVGLEAELRAS